MTKEIKKGYKFSEEVYADTCFDAWGNNLNELFTNCALALSEIMIDLKTLKFKIKKKINLKNNTIDALLIEFLEEIIYLKDAEMLLFSKFHINIKNVDDTYVLEAEISGDKIDQKTQKLGIDAKAITYHKFKVEQKNDKWYAHIIIDV